MEDTSNTAKPAKGALNPLMYVVIAAILALLFICCGYIFGHASATKLTKQQAQLSAQVASLQKKTKQQEDINNGVVPAGVTYKDPQGGLGLLEGRITFTMPKGWERLPLSRCSSYSIDSTVLCYDTAAIAPKTQSSDAKDPYWQANVSVFEY